MPSNVFASRRALPSVLLLGCLIESELVLLLWLSAPEPSSGATRLLCLDPFFRNRLLTLLCLLGSEVVGEGGSPMGLLALKLDPPSEPDRDLGDVRLEGMEALALGILMRAAWLSHGSYNSPRPAGRVLLRIRRR